MKLRSTAIALGVGVATAAGLSLLKLDKPVVIGSTFVVVGAGLVISSKKKGKSPQNLDSPAKEISTPESESSIAQSYFSNGLQKNKLGDYAGAISDYSKTIEINPRDSDAYYNRGRIKINGGDRFCIGKYNI